MRDEAADDAWLDFQLRYLDGFPAAQSAARETFETRRRRRLIYEAQGQAPVTLATYAMRLANRRDADLLHIGQLVAAMLDHALIAQDALVTLEQWGERLADLAAGLPPIDGAADVPKLVTGAGELATQLQDLADLFGEASAVLAKKGRE